VILLEYEYVGLCFYWACEEEHSPLELIAVAANIMGFRSLSIPSLRMCHEPGDCRYPLPFRLPTQVLCIRPLVILRDDLVRALRAVGDKYSVLIRGIFEKLELNRSLL